MFGQVAVWDGYSPMDSFLFLAAWTSGHNWAMKRPVLHPIRQPQNHKWESWWLSFKWTQRCLLQVPWCNLSIRVPLELKKWEAWGVSSKKKSGYQLKMVDHSIWHSKTFRWRGSVQYSARATTWQFRFRESSVTDYRYKFQTMETGVGETQQWWPTTGAASNHERSWGVTSSWFT